MLAKAIIVHGVIGYKFCWLLPDDQNQGIPVGHESNGTTVRDHWEDMNQLRHQLGTYQSWAQGFRSYEQLKALLDMNGSQSWAQAFRMNNSRLWLTWKALGHELKPLDAMHNSQLSMTWNTQGCELRTPDDMIWTTLGYGWYERF